MAKSVKVIVIRTAGTNCDTETAYAFQSFGAKADLVHINYLLDGSCKLHDYHILAVPGGFTYGDDIESGRILANELKEKLGGEIKKFIADKKLVIGICNGFQVLAKAGILFDGSISSNSDFSQQVTLTSNDSGKFEDRWVHLKVEGDSIWTKGLDDVVYYPVAHAEGKFVAPAAVLKRLNTNGQVAFRYCAPDGERPDYPDNPNGSLEDIAGITDPTGRILGLMPHPERHFMFVNHPQWTRMSRRSKFGQGARIFQNGCEYAKLHHSR